MFVFALRIISLACLLFLSLMLRDYSAENCPLFVRVFLFTQILTVVTQTVGETFWTRMGSPQYRWIYTVLSIPAIAAALGLSMYSLKSVGMWRLMIAEIALCALMATEADNQWGRGKTFPTIAAMFIIAGLFLLLSMAKWLNPSFDHIRLLLGLFMFSEGILMWLAPAWYASQPEVAKVQVDWAMPMIAITAFVTMGYLLYRANPR